MNSQDSELRSQKKGKPITAEWLSSSGFRWSQVDGQPSKQWLLWLGRCDEGGFTSTEDLGLELASRGGKIDRWNCWLRADTSSRYHRFIHIREIRFQHEVISLVVALTGSPWRPECHLYGAWRRRSEADYLRREQQRLDRRILERQARWSESEKDETRSKPLREHLDLAIKAGKSK